MVHGYGDLDNFFFLRKFCEWFFFCLTLNSSYVIIRAAGGSHLCDYIWATHSQAPRLSKTYCGPPSNRNAGFHSLEFIAWFVAMSLHWKEKLCYKNDVLKLVISIPVNCHTFTLYLYSNAITHDCNDYSWNASEEFVSASSIARGWSRNGWMVPSSIGIYWLYHLLGRRQLASFRFAYVCIYPCLADMMLKKIVSNKSSCIICRNIE